MNEIMKWVRDIYHFNNKTSLPPLALQLRPQNDRNSVLPNKRQTYNHGRRSSYTLWASYRLLQFSSGISFARRIESREIEHFFQFIRNSENETVRTREEFPKLVLPQRMPL